MGLAWEFPIASISHYLSNYFNWWRIPFMACTQQKLLSGFYAATSEEQNNTTLRTFMVFVKLLILLSVQCKIHVTGSPLTIPQCLVRNVYIHQCTAPWKGIAAAGGRATWTEGRRKATYIFLILCIIYVNQLYNRNQVQHRIVSGKIWDSLNNAENVSYYMAKKRNPIRHSSLFTSKMVIAPILRDAVSCTLHF